MVMNPETKIGLVVTGGLLILAIGIFALGDIQWQSGYELKVMFNDVSGLPEKAPVKSAGASISLCEPLDVAPLRVVASCLPSQGRCGEVVAAGS